MYEFLDRLIAVALPRTRDFRGVKSKGDGRGNFTIGITENIIFPEMDIDKVNKDFRNGYYHCNLVLKLLKKALHC